MTQTSILVALTLPFLTAIAPACNEVDRAVLPVSVKSAIAPIATKTDCGGAAAVCPGEPCGSGTACASGRYEGNVCVQATCNDGVRNGRETQVDCGGEVCPSCPIAEADTIAPQADAVGAFVLVPVDTWLYRAPSLDAERFAIREAPGAGTGARSMPERAVIVAEQDGWLKITAPQPGKAHCVDRPGVLHDYGLTVFIPRAELMPVVTRDVVVEMAKGPVTVKAGRWAPLNDRGVGRRSGVDIPDAAIGWHYVSNGLSPDLEGYSYSVDEDTVYFGGASSPSGLTRRVVEFTWVAGRPGFAKVVVRSRCEEETLIVRAVDGAEAGDDTAFGSLEPGDTAFGDSGGFGTASDEPVVKRPTIRRGAKVYWPGGAVAGKTTTTIYPDVEVDRSGNRRCFASGGAPPIGPGLGGPVIGNPGATPTYTFCVAPEDVK